MSTTQKPKVFTTAILTAKNFKTNVTVKCGAILETQDGDEFLLLNYLLDYSDFIDPRRVDNGHIRVSIVERGDWHE
jgi:hypothetical protein